MNSMVFGFIDVILSNAFLFVQVSGDILHSGVFGLFLASSCLIQNESLVSLYLKSIHCIGP
jgi:hypothetical protein